jgi:thiol-disulfide isomerase/thioredoxin
MQKVEFITAPWCGRCKTVKPDVEMLCKAAGLPLTYVNMDDMEETEKEMIKSLPTIRTTLKDGIVQIHTSATLEAWKAAVKEVIVTSVITTGTDF